MSMNRNQPIKSGTFQMHDKQSIWKISKAELCSGGNEI